MASIGRSLAANRARRRDRWRRGGSKSCATPVSVNKLRSSLSSGAESGRKRQAGSLQGGCGRNIRQARNFPAVRDRARSSLEPPRVVAPITVLDQPRQRFAGEARTHVDVGVLHEGEKLEIVRKP